MFRENFNKFFVFPIEKKVKICYNRNWQKTGVAARNQRKER